MIEILLDRFGDAQIPQGYSQITDEVSFLTSITEDGKWVICGRRLCDWAEAVCNARRLRVALAPSLVRDLEDAFPLFDAEALYTVATRISSTGTVIRRPVTPLAIMQALYPGGPWVNNPSLEHFAEWLLWLDTTETSGKDSIILGQVLHIWQQKAPAQLKPLYSFSDQTSAREVLARWLGIEPGGVTFTDKPFPLDVPTHWKQAAVARWRKSLLETSGRLCVQLADYTLPPQLRYHFAREAFGYFQSNPAHLTEESVILLTPLLSIRDKPKLRKLLRPIDPPDVPGTAEEVLTWFKSQYLPFREWQNSTDKALEIERVVELGKQFARWYLEFYRNALLSGRHLNFFQTAALKREKSRFATLLVVLDGLHLPDALHLVSILSGATTRLVIRENTLTFATLPTVTQFAKEALLRGVPPCFVDGTGLLAEEISERNSPIERLRTASSGDLYIWRILEPDHTYHSRNTHKNLERDIEGQLHTIGQKIADVVEELPAEIVLRLVITTDHGRLLGTSVRSVGVPAGMMAHGRAAWGALKVDFPEAGYFVEDNIAYLQGGRFGLGYDAAIILDETSFRTNDGKQGQERYAHGGLFPEEVIIPWIVLVRDIATESEKPPSITAKLVGQAVARQQGTALLEISNAETGSVAVTEVRIVTGSAKPDLLYELELSVPGRQSRNAELTFESWPTNDELKQSRAKAIMSVPSGEHFEIPIAIELESKEMYSRDTSLLEGLDL